MPIIHTLIAEKKDLVTETHCEPQVVIISPTRELADQIHKEARKFSYDTGVKCVVTYGGTSVGYQLKHVLVS